MIFCVQRLVKQHNNNNNEKKIVTNFKFKYMVLYHIFVKNLAVQLKYTAYLKALKHKFTDAESVHK